MKALEIKKLEKTYKGWKKVLKNVDLYIEDGDFFSLLWVNWAWKTTIIWILTDLVVKDSWQISVYWKDLEKEKHAAKQMIWVVPQEFNLDFFQKVIDILTTQAWYYGIPLPEAEKRADELLEALWLSDKKHAKAMQLSGGMKRRVMIARALMHKPKLLILDEPTAWVDINLRKSTWEYLQKLNKEGTTILLTTHYLDEVEELCNRIAVMREWEVIANCEKEELFEMIKNLSYEIETTSNFSTLPENLAKFNAKKTWENKIHIELSKEDSLDEVISELNKENIKIKTINKKTNEIEELFIKLTQNA